MKDKLSESAAMGSMYNLLYQYELMKQVLTVISNCSENSTLEGIKGLAKKTLEEVNHG